MRLLLLFFISIIFLDTNAQILINEYSAANYGDFLDNNGEYEDWFELYNSSSNEINLQGYYLSDKENNLTKFQINTSIEINGLDHLTIFASGRNTISGNNIHTNFKIHQTKGNEWIILTAPDGITIIDSVFVLPCLVDQSRGRKTDGEENWGLFINANPNNNNTNAINGYSETPSFSITPGSYMNNMSLEITCADPNVNIYYTTNGNIPTTGGNLYTGSISLNETTVIKTFSVSEDENLHPSFMEFGTFFISDSYSLPILSVAGNLVDDLLDGNDYIEPWGTFEYYKGGVLADKATGEFNEHGNDSWNYAQRGFDFIIRDQFGYNYAIQDELFRTKSRDRYQRLIIKTAANDNYPFAYGSSGAHIRDAYVQSLSQIADLRMDERSFEPCILFLNGEYWGLYEIREKVDDKDFTDYYYDQDSVAFLKTWGNTWVDVLSDDQTEDSVEDEWDDIREFITNNDMSIPDNYNYAKSVFNMGSLIDYFILNTYVVNADWLNWNTAWWKGLRESGEKKKWRYVLWDMDNTFDHGANYTDIPSQNPNSDPCDPEGIGNQGGQGHIPIWNALLNNQTFFADYINRWTDLSNSYFSCEYLINHLDSLINMIDPEMPKQIDRWGGNYNEWQGNVQDMRDFIETRCAVINSGILDCYEDEFGILGPFNVSINIEPPMSGNLEINGAELDVYPFSGSYFGGVNQTLIASPNIDYIFDYWEFSNNTISDDINDPEIIYNLSGNESIIAHFAPNISISLDAYPSGSGSIIVDEDIFDNLPTSTSINGETLIYAVPEPGFVFDHWELSGGYILSTNNISTLISISDNQSLIAYFTPLPTLIFDVSPAGSGDIFISGETFNNLPTITYINGTTPLSAIPETGFIFDHWELTAGTLGDSENSETTISISEDQTLIAYFIPIELEILLNCIPSEGATILIGNQTISQFPQNLSLVYGQNYTISSIINENFFFEEWTSVYANVNNTLSESTSTSFYQNDTITLNLGELFDLTFIIEPNGSGSIKSNGIETAPYPYTQKLEKFTQVSMQATPYLGMKFVNWELDNAILETNEFYTHQIDSDDTIKVIFDETELELFIPNSFSPNGDGLNDVFKPGCDEDKIASYELIIFDEWGGFVFSSTDIENGWEGPNSDQGKSNFYVYKIIAFSNLTGSRYVFEGSVLVL